MNDEPRFLVPAVVFVALVVAAVGSLGSPLITAVSEQYDVSLAASQWTLTIVLLSGAVATPVLGRLGSGPHRRTVVLTTLGIVVLGSALTVVPLPFAVLLIGRAAQGTGLGLTALMMATATDHLGERRAASTIALLSVASTAGIGVGYPLAGALTDAAGIRAAYGLGLVVTALAFVAAFVVLPQAPPRPGRRVDVPGAVLLAVGLLALLVVISQTELWRDHATWTAVILVVALLLLVLWAVVETRVEHPLVDIRLLRHPAVAGANLVMFTGGIGMYLLLSVITRYVQTPASTGYGFDLNTFEAGLVLVPFSVAGFAAGKFLPRLHLSPRSRLAASATTVLAAFLLFALTRSHLAGSVVAMTVLGLGVGAFAASMPAVILAVTPKSETASAMSVNQVVRSTGFSIGSALAGIVLAAHTTAQFPTEAAYATAAWTGAAITAATIALTLGVLRRT